MLIVLRSDTYPLWRLDAFARTVISPRLSAIAGVAQVTIIRQPEVCGAHPARSPDPGGPWHRRGRGGARRPRCQRSYACGLPHDGSDQQLTIEVSTQLGDAQAWRDLIIANRNGRPIRLGDVAKVIDSVEDDQRASWHNGSPALVLAVQRQPDASTIEVVDKVRAALPRIQEELGPGVSLTTMNDRSLSIRTAIEDVTFTLVLTIGLVCAVLYLGIGRLATTLIPSVTIPVSIVATFAAMYALGLSLDNITLLALTLSVGLVVDDAIVVTDNIVRHIEAGTPPHAGSPEGSEGGCLHGHIDHRVAHRGIHSAAADGRRGRTHPQPLRHHGLGLAGDLRSGLPEPYSNARRPPARCQAAGGRPPQSGGSCDVRADDAAMAFAST